jgi:hypothetical protein
MKKKTFELYDNKEDAFHSGYAESTENTLLTLINFQAFDEDFMLMVLKFFIKHHKKNWQEIFKRFL